MLSRRWSDALIGAAGAVLACAAPPRGGGGSAVAQTCMKQPPRPGWRASEAARTPFRADRRRQPALELAPVMPGVVEQRVDQADGDGMR
jgi:hypothetical protein